MSVFQSILSSVNFHKKVAVKDFPIWQPVPVDFAANETVGLIAGGGQMPIAFAREAKRRGLKVAAVAHLGNATSELEKEVDKISWIKVGQLGEIIKFFKENDVKKAVMLGGINRVKAFSDVSVDLRGALMLAQLRTTKDDLVMRGVSAELAKDGIEIIDSTIFAGDNLAPEMVLTSREPTAEEKLDIEVGRQAISAMSAQHIGQLVVVKGGVIVAVEAVEGSDECIRRGTQLGGPGVVIVKCAKPDQDMRFDVPTVGLKTIETMIAGSARVLALEAGRCLILDKEAMIALANRHGITVIGCPRLVSDANQ